MRCGADVGCVKHTTPTPDLDRMNMITEQERKIAQTLRALSDNAPVDPPTHKSAFLVAALLFQQKGAFADCGHIPHHRIGCFVQARSAHCLLRIAGRAC